MKRKITAYRHKDKIIHKLTFYNPNYESWDARHEIKMMEYIKRNRLRYAPDDGGQQDIILN